MRLPARRADPSGRRRRNDYEETSSSRRSAVNRELVDDIQLVRRDNRGRYASAEHCKLQDKESSKIGAV
jgi:hypothetical protein